MAAHQKWKHNFLGTHTQTKQITPEYLLEKSSLDIFLLGRTTPPNLFLIFLLFEKIQLRNPSPKPSRGKKKRQLPG